MSADPWTGCPLLQVAKANLMPFGPGGGQEPGWDESLHLIVVVSGGGLVETGGNRHRMNVGEGLAIPWAATVSYQADRQQGMTIASIHLVPWSGNGLPTFPRFIPGGEERRSRNPPPGLPPLPTGVRRMSCRPSLTELALETVAVWSDHRLGDGWRAYRLRGLAACLATALDQKPPSVNRLDAFLWWLRENCSRRITRAEMCRRAGLGSTALGKAVRAATGQSPTAYLIGLRLEWARGLLASTGMTVQQVALHVGIPDRPHFTQLYRRRFGHSPRDV